MKSTLLPRIHNQLSLLVLCAIMGCSNHNDLGIQGLPGSPHPTDIKINSKSFLGTWSLTDINNELFNVTIDENGTARSNWSVDSIMGEFGTWTEYEGRWGKGIAITYRDGWRDLILAGSRGYEKASFKPRSSTKGWPNSFGIAVRLRGVRVPLSGVFSTMSKNGSQENVLNLKSNGLAQSSQRPNNPGVWTPRNQDAWIYWADDWREHLIYDSTTDSYELRSWKPAAEGRGTPTRSRSAIRIKKPHLTPQ